MIKIFDFRNSSYFTKLSKLLIKRKIKSKIGNNIVEKIISDVKNYGDKALIKYEKKYSKNTEIIANKKKYQKALVL